MIRLNCLAKSCLKSALFVAVFCEFSSVIAPGASAQQLAVAGYHLLSSARATKEQHDNTYAVDLVNGGGPVNSLTAVVASSSPNTIVLNGAVPIGPLPADSTVPNAVTITVRQNIQVSFDPSVLIWTFPQTNSIQLSATKFSFPDTFVGSPLTRTVTTLTNTGAGTLTLKPKISGNGSFTVAAGGCGQILAPAASCDMVVQFLPIDTRGQEHSGILQLGIAALDASVNQSVALDGDGVTLEPGTVAQTANAQVAQYNLTLPAAGSWSVNFGPTTSYGFTTWVQSASGKVPSSMYVAGMLPNTIYHMQATVTLPGGSTAVDQDQTFTTGVPAGGMPLGVSATTTPGMTPQPGIELVNTIGNPIPSDAFATDLQGNVIWAYQFPDRAASSFLLPMKLLPNGHMMCLIAPTYPTQPTPGMLNVIREIDLAGNTIQELSMDDLNARLAANGFSLTLNAFSHDFQLLPNGHYLVIANLIKLFTDLPGYPDGIQVAGDAVVDLDSNLQPRWVWNSFDHLDVNRHPMQFPDWTHANSIAYSKDDGNFIISLRHQNWILKIDYQNGTGTGNVVWHLGEEGDFTLQGATDPTDWFYAQHYANFTSPNTTGVFSLELFDNGDDRIFTKQMICGPLPGQTPCLYSTVAEMQIDENAMTASFLFHDILAAPLHYSFFAGNNDLLPNGNFQYDLAGTIGTLSSAWEVKPGATLADPPETVWQMHLPTGEYTYRMERWPSLYPGVQW